jgi:LysM repeat protein
MLINFRRVLRLVAFFCLVSLIAFPFLAYAQQTYPGAAFFSYQCGSSGIAFSFNGSPVLQAGFSEISGPLSVAIATRQNQPIKIGSEFGLWALQSDELQIHQNKDPDLTKLVISSAVCGRIVMVGNGNSQGFSGQALAYVQVDGPGQALAYAQVTSSGSVLAYAQLVGSGQAVAAAQSSGTGGATSLPANSGQYHVVKAGENLFRIALRYGTTVSVLAAINHISDPTRIYVGQKIYLP